MKENKEVFSVSDGDAYCWVEQESSVMLKAVTKSGDPVELTKEEAIDVDMRTYLADLDGDLHDIRGRSDLVDIYAPDNYAAGQTLGRQLKAINSYGIAYNSVRHAGGECVAVFRPRILSNCIQGPHFCYVWDGTHIKTIYEKKIYDTD